MSRMLAFLTLCAIPALGSHASAFRGPPTAYLSEVAVNPPGPDNSLEYIEITGEPGLDMSGKFILIIEGDGGGAGTIDQVIPLSGVIGSTGVYLLRDAALVLRPTPPAGTTIVVRDFQPDLENGSTTVIFGTATGDLPLPGTDLDADNDGVFDAELPLEVIDAISYQDNVTGGTQYAAGVGGTNFGSFTTFTPGMFYRLLDAQGRIHRWAGGVGMGASPGPFRLTANAHFGFDLSGLNTATFEFDPGTPNDRLDTGACCFPDDSCMTLTRLECAAMTGGGFWPGAACDAFVCPAVTDYAPREISEGGVVTIDVRELAIIAADAGVVARYGATLVPFEVVARTDTQVRAIAGPVPPGAGPAQLFLQGGAAHRGTFTPMLPEVMTEHPLGTLAWRAADQPALLGPGELSLLADADPPGTTSYAGQVVEGRISLALADAWPVNAAVHIWLRVRGVQNGAPFHHDLTTTVRFRCASAPADAAARLCDAIRSAMAQQTPPITLTCSPVDLMDGRFEVQVSIPNGAINDGGLIVRATSPVREQIHPAALDVSAFGGASLEPIEQGLAMRGLGPTGKDGATILLPAANLSGVSLAIDPIALDAPGRCVELDLWGAWNDAACRRLASAAACADSDGAVRFTTTLALGASTMTRVDVFQGNDLVGTVTLANGAVGEMRGIDAAPVPLLASWQMLPARPAPGFRFSFADRFSFTPTGGTPLVGDSVRLLAVGQASPIQSIDLFDQTITNPAEAPPIDLVMRSAEFITAACACDFNLDQAITSQDFFGFIACFFTENCPEADHNADGGVNTQDFFDFLACFFGPPPECS